MADRVERDLNRFRQIVRGKIKRDLRKYMSQGEMIGRQGRRYVSIPLPQIDIPQFRFGQKQGGGVGAGGAPRPAPTLPPPSRRSIFRSFASARNRAAASGRARAMWAIRSRAAT